MRYRDCPTVEVSERIHGNIADIWATVTDITFPVEFSAASTGIRRWVNGIRTAW